MTNIVAARRRTSVEVTFEDLDRGNLNHKIPLRVALWPVCCATLGMPRVRSYVGLNIC
jgi:hypothetical protein